MSEKLFLNHYVCPDCKHTWSDLHSATVDMPCQQCGTSNISPVASEDVVHPQTLSKLTKQILSKPGECPFCHSDDVNQSGALDGELHLVSKMKCDTCKKTWHEEYRFLRAWSENEVQQDLWEVVIDIRAAEHDCERTMYFYVEADRRGAAKRKAVALANQSPWFDPQETGDYLLVASVRQFNREHISIIDMPTMQERCPNCGTEPIAHSRTPGADKLTVDCRTCGMKWTEPTKE